MHASLQRKFSFSYIAIILAVLILLNTYPLITSENLTFRSKQSSLQGSVSVMVTALSGLEELSEENVAGAMTLVEETGISRVLVTDASGRVLYDTRETDGAIGRYAFYTELVQALRGEDVFYTEFSDKAFKSRAASPVIYHSQTIGAVYAYEYDTEQAELLLSLQRNLLTISAVVLVFAGGISVLLSRVLTRRFGVLTDAIRKMRELVQPPRRGRRARRDQRARRRVQRHGRPFADDGGRSPPLRVGREPRAQNAAGGHQASVRLHFADGEHGRADRARICR